MNWYDMNKVITLARILYFLRRGMNVTVSQIIRGID